jgi:hypothetical protein
MQLNVILWCSCSEPALQLNNAVTCSTYPVTTADTSARFLDVPLWLDGALTLRPGRIYLLSWSGALGLGLGWGHYLSAMLHECVTARRVLEWRKGQRVAPSGFVIQGTACGAEWVCYEPEERVASIFRSVSNRLTLSSLTPFLLP